MPYFLLTLLVLIFDQVVKVIVTLKLEPFQDVWVVKNVFSLTCVHNYGAAFGILRSKTLLLITLSAAVILFVWIKRKKIACYPKGFQIGLALALGGALGNLIDRIRLGYVVDFLNFQVWPVFNLADIAIVTGVGLIIVSLYSDKSKSEEKYSCGPAEDSRRSAGEEDV